MGRGISLASQATDVGGEAQSMLTAAAELEQRRTTQNKQIVQANKNANVSMGATTGAMAGTMIMPGIGTLIGGVAGALFGSLF
jgi:uncharacterized membrane protein